MVNDQFVVHHTVVYRMEATADQITLAFILSCIQDLYAFCKVYNIFEECIFQRLYLGISSVR